MGHGNLHGVITAFDDSIIAACDYTVKIPMSHGVDSLNVAAAAAVAFWELRIRYKEKPK